MYVDLPGTVWQKLDLRPGMWQAQASWELPGSTMKCELTTDVILLVLCGSM